MPQVES